VRLRALPSRCVPLHALGLAVAWIALACAGPAGPGSSEAAAPFHLSQVAGDGDAARRASSRLVIEGLEADAAGRAAGALSRYEHAVQVDPTNPWAWLALARHELDVGRPDRTLSYLEKAEALLPGRSLGVEAHLAGLRGSALRDLGRGSEAVGPLERARRLAPAAWADGRLDAAELR